MTLREQYYKLKNDIEDEYNRLMNVGDYDILNYVINEHYDGDKEELLKVLEEEGADEVCSNWDILEWLTPIYYNDNKGEERLCYLLRAEKENGLYVFDEEVYETRFIHFLDLNGVYNQLTVIEELQNS